MGRPKPAVTMEEYLADENKPEVTRKSKKKQCLTIDQAMSLDEASKIKVFEKQNKRIKEFSELKVGDAIAATFYYNSDDRYRRTETIKGKIIHITPWKFITVRTRTPTRIVNTTVDFNGYVAGRIKIEVIKGFEAIN